MNPRGSRNSLYVLNSWRSSKHVGIRLKPDAAFSHTAELPAKKVEKAITFQSKI